MNKTLVITCTAMLCALSVVANVFTIPLVPNFSKVISFTIFVTVLAGVYLGPWCGAAVGFLGDLIAHFANPIGGMGYNWFIGLSCALTGLIAGYIFRLKLHRLVKLAITLALCFLVCTSVLNNFGLWMQVIVGLRPSPSGFIMLFTTDLSQIKKTFWVYALGRTPVALLNTAINGVLLAAILQTKIIDKLFNHFNQKPDRADKNNAVCCDSAADNGEENALTSAADNATSATTDGAVVADNSSENTQSSTDFKSQNSGIHSTKG